MSEVQTQTNEVNTNTLVQTEPISVAGGDSPVSWDDLESISQHLNLKNEQKTDSKELQSFKFDENEPDFKQNRDQKTKVDTFKQNAKLLKLKSNGKDIELMSDTMVPVKIDGKIVDVPIQEAINRYSQQSHLDKLYNGFKQEQSKFESERKAISDVFNKSYDLLVNQKDLRGFFDIISQAMGQDSESLYQEHMLQIGKELEEFNTMTPEERRIRKLERENRVHREQTERVKQSEARAKSMKELETQAQEVMKQTGMSEKDLVDTFEELKKLGYEESKIDLNQIASYHNAVKTHEFVKEQVSKLAPQVSDDSVMNITEHALKVGASKDEIAEAIKQLYGDNSGQQLAKKLIKTDRLGRLSKPRNFANEPDLWGFDQL